MFCWKQEKKGDVGLAGYTFVYPHLEWNKMIKAGFEKLKNFGKEAFKVVVVFLWVTFVHIFLVGINFHSYFTACMPENSYTCTFFGLICANGYLMDINVIMISFVIAFLIVIFLLGFLLAMED